MDFEIAGDGGTRGFFWKSTSGARLRSSPWGACPSLMKGNSVRTCGGEG